MALADAALDQGEYARAEVLLSEAHDLLGQFGASAHLIECEFRLSVLYRHWAPPHGFLLAVKHAQRALQQARHLKNPRSLAWSLAYAAIAECVGGDPVLGQRLAEEAVVVARPLQMPGLSGFA